MVVLTFHHCISTGFRISKKSHGGPKEELVGTGQGNMVSGSICRDQSCIVFKELEKMKKGLSLMLLLAAKKVRRTQIACVDDTDFYANGLDCAQLMQEIIDKHVKLCEATGAKIQEEKVKFYCWKHDMREGKRTCT